MSGGNRSLISSGGFLQMTSTSGAIYLSPNSSAALTLASTGAATFSNSVMVNGSTVSTEGLSVQYNQAKTYTTQTAVSRWHSNESSGSQFKLNLFATGNATGSSRVFSFQTSNEGVANDGIISFQAAGGNVGIGTSTIAGVISTDIVTQIHNSGGSSRALLRLTNNISGTAWNGGAFIGFDSALDLYLANQSNGNLNLQSNNVTRMTVTAGGNILMGTTSDNGERLYISGNVRATGTITANSDISLKKNLLRIENALEKVEQINGYTYEFKEDDSKRHAGLIAQEIQTVLPEIVNKGNDGILGVEYGNISALLIEAIKEQNTKIKNLESLLASK
jgi:hypothetical protein